MNNKNSNNTTNMCGNKNNNNKNYKKINNSQKLSSTTVPRMDKWEIPRLQTIHYMKLSILAVAYLVAGLD